MEQFLLQFGPPVITGILGIMGWFLKGALDKVNELDEKFNNLHETYVKKNDFTRFEDKIEKHLTRIEAKLDKQILRIE